MDKGYDVSPVYEGLEELNCRPVAPLRQTTGVARGDAEPPTCDHGTWTSRDRMRNAVRPSGVVPQACALLPLGGSRPTACTR